MYEENAWENACLTCPEPMTGATSFSVCALCPGGSYSNVTGAHINRHHSTVQVWGVYSLPTAYYFVPIEVNFVLVDMGSSPYIADLVKRLNIDALSHECLSAGALACISCPSGTYSNSTGSAPPYLECKGVMGYKAGCEHKGRCSVQSACILTVCL
jgi:hypothetical protein